MKKESLPNQGVNRREFMKVVGLIGMASGLNPFSSLSTAWAAKAEEVYPTRNITLICDSDAGGGSDMNMRGVAALMPDYVRAVSPGCKGGDIVVKNVPQAGGLKANIDTYNAKPDGYTIGNFNVGKLYEYTLGPNKPPFDLTKFTWIMTPSATIYSMYSGKSGPGTWEEMLALAKKRELKMVAGSHSGVMHLNSIWIKEVLGIPIKIINTTGSTGVVGGLVRGDSDIAVLPAESAKGAVKSGELRVLVTFDEKRFYPDVPTIIEKGVPELAKYVGGYRIIMGPPNMDREATRVLIEASRRMIQDPKYVAYVEKLEGAMSPLVGAEVGTTVEDRIKWYAKMAPVFSKHMR